MKSRRRLRNLGVVLCLFGMGADLQRAHAQQAVEAVPVPSMMVDVAVGDGMLVGEVRSMEGNPLAGRKVHVLFQGNEVAVATTDPDGSFRVGGIREGVHELICCNRSTTARIWQAEAAPPQAGKMVCLVCDECEEVAAPCPPPARHMGPLAKAFACYPIATVALLGAGIGAAIAIPIATSQKPASP